MPALPRRRPLSELKSGANFAGEAHQFQARFLRLVVGVEQIYPGAVLFDTRLLHDQAVDLVITDLIMPEKEGVETISELRRRYPEIKIIAMSGGGMGGATDYLRLAKALGAGQTLAKPFTREVLLKMVTAAFAPTPSNEP